MSDYIFDIETDDLLIGCTKLHCVVLIDIDTQEIHKFRPNDDKWAYLLESSDIVSGHNIMGFDLPALNKLTNFKLPKAVRAQDTLILSEVLNYRRFGFKGHSLRVWGEYLDFPKIEFKEFEEFSEEMLKYCIQDTMLNLKVYYILAEELARMSQSKHFGKLIEYIKAEHSAATWCARAELEGWPFNVKAAFALKDELEEKIAVATKRLQPKLGCKVVAVDKVKEEVPAKQVKWTKDGFYHAHIANWFDIEPCEGHPSMSQPIMGDYSRIKVAPLGLNSVNDVKIFLNRVGWKPTEFNYKKVNVDGRTKSIPSSPKITEDSLEFLGGDGKLYAEYLMANSRNNILHTWLENIDENGNLHGNCKVIGTPSMRATHRVIVNVPSLDSEYGPEMRELFVAKPGWKIVGCDSKGNQARALAHYLNDKEYIRILLEEDIHQYNADKLTSALHKLGFTKDILIDKGLPDGKVPRSAAKRVFYALLFGAAGTKLWIYIFKETNADKGNDLKKAFLKEVPGFAGLIKSLNKTFSSTLKQGYGYIPSIAGNRIYVDSRHKLLVYLLQACEKITCATAVKLAMDELDERGIPYVPLIFYHDEFQVMVPEENAEEVKEIGSRAFKEAPKRYGITIMDGDGMIGNNWKETH